MVAVAVDELLLLLDLTDLRRCLVPPLLAGLLDDAADVDPAEPECLSGFLPVLPPPPDAALPLLPPLLPTVAMRGDSGADDE